MILIEIVCHLRVEWFTQKKENSLSWFSGRVHEVGSVPYVQCSLGVALVTLSCGMFTFGKRELRNGVYKPFQQRAVDPYKVPPPCLFPLCSHLMNSYGCLMRCKCSGHTNTISPSIASVFVQTVSNASDQL